MSNKVQSYLQEEVLDLVIDPVALDQWHDLINEMGLKGQGQIAEPKKSPIPYLFMTPAMVATFEVLCPREVKLEEYKSGAIPLKALEHIKLAQGEGHFHRIMIRYDDKAPDPVAIGEIGDYWASAPQWRRLEPEEVKDHKGAFFSASDRFLIARWGEEADTLENLAIKAKARFMREEGATLNKAIKDAQNKMSVLEEDATLRFNC